MRFVAGLLPILSIGFVFPAAAAPKLRLSTATVGPISIAQGANGNTQTIEASNAGDGNLNLSTSSSASWVSATVGASRPCAQQPGNCLPVNFAFQTTALARGSYTAAVTLSDSGALDAPQIVTVTVQIGGGVPDSANLYVAPNGSIDDVRFSTNSAFIPSVTTQTGGPWLSLSLDGSGSFRFVMPYRITGRHLEGMAEGTYTGSAVISGAGLPAENKTIPVTMVVTSQPIARVTPSALNLRLAAGAPELRAGLTVFNGGLGTLTVNGATASTNSGGNWLSVQTNGGSVAVTANSSGLAAGIYTGSIAVNSNAANSNLTIPVQLTVVPQGAPLSTFNGVVNPANLDNAIAPGGIASVNGEQLSGQSLNRYTQAPVGDNLGGVRVLVNDRAAPVYASAYNQVSFQVPYEIGVGEAIIKVERDGTTGNSVTAPVVARAPRIVQQGDFGVIMNSNGTMAAQRAPKPGEAVTLFVVGLGETTPKVATGEAAPVTGPLARVNPAPRVLLGNGISGVMVLESVFAGLTPNAVGLAQVTFVVPADAPSGDLALAIEGDDYRSNTVLISIRN